MRGAIIRIASGLMTYAIGARSSEVSKASPNSALIQWRRRLRPLRTLLPTGPIYLQHLQALQKVRLLQAREEGAAVGVEREVIVEVLEEHLKEELAEGLEGAPEEDLEETTEELEATPEEELVVELVVELVSCELRI